MVMYMQDDFVPETLPGRKPFLRYLPFSLLIIFDEVY